MLLAEVHHSIRCRIDLQSVVCRDLSVQDCQCSLQLRYLGGTAGFEEGGYRKDHKELQMLVGIVAGLVGDPLVADLRID